MAAACSIHGGERERADRQRDRAGAQWRKHNFCESHLLLFNHDEFISWGGGETWKWWPEHEGSENAPVSTAGFAAAQGDGC